MAVLNRQKFIEYAETHWPSVIYAKTDCQQFVEDAAKYAGWAFNSSGSNDMYRNYLKTKGSTLNFKMRAGDVAFRMLKPGEEGYDLPGRYANHADKNDYFHVAVLTEIKDGKYTVCHSSGHKSNGRRDTFNSLSEFAKRYPCVGTLKNTSEPKGTPVTPVVVEPKEPAGAQTPVLTVNETEKAIWNFFTQKGLNQNAVAGIMGNLYVESKLEPKCLTSTALRKKYNNNTYTQAVDNGKVDFVHGGGAYGLAQWCYWSRKEALQKYAKEQKKSIGDLNMQLEFMWKEMQSYKTMMAVLLAGESVDACGRSVMLKYEKPANQTEKNQLNRVKYCQQYLDKYGVIYEKTPQEVKQNYLYKVDIFNTKLNYRIGPAKTYKTKGYITPGLYEVTKEQGGFAYLPAVDAWVMLNVAWMKIMK